VKTLAIFGVGPGLGIATARRFGKEGYRVALVSRNPERLQSFVDDLAAEGVEAAAFPADLSDRDKHADLVDAIKARFGGIDVAVINGLIEFDMVRPVLDIDVESMQAVLEGVLYAPLSLTKLVLPGMLANGDGGLLYGLGSSAKNPMLALAVPGAAQAGLRNYIHNLHTELADKGVYAGALTLGVLIERSDVQQLHDTAQGFGVEQDVERADPDELAALYWDLYTRRDRPEATAGALAA
jgi:short-subunit dehydrogenase